MSGNRSEKKRKRKTGIYYVRAANPRKEDLRFGYLVQFLLLLLRRSDDPERDLVQCIPQICERIDPEAASWVAAKENDVDCARFFLKHPLPAGDYNLLQLAALSSS